MRARRVVTMAAVAPFLVLSHRVAAVPKPSPGAATTPVPSATPPTAPTSGPKPAPGSTPLAPPDATVPSPGDATDTTPPGEGAAPETTIPTPVRRGEGAAKAPARGGARGQALLDVEGEDDAEADTTSAARSARDTLGSHLVIGANGGLFIPAGSFDDVTYQSDRLSLGPSFGADIGYGVSRTVVLGVYGDLGLPHDQTASDSPLKSCSSCGGSSLSVGPFVRYHLVQGVRFDPWLSAGTGFRKTTLGSASWVGWDVIRVALGGDFYGWSSFGFGPFAEFAVGTYFDATPKLTSHNVNANFTLGLRVVFDAPGK